MGNVSMIPLSLVSVSLNNHMARALHKLSNNEFIMRT
jgi:hypothetical protein